MKAIFFLAAALCATTAFGQVTFDLGLPLINDRYVNLVSGSAFFNDAWLNSHIVLQDGTTYHNVKGKLDLVANEFQYTDASGRTMVANGPVKEIIFEDSKGQNYQFVNASALTAKPPRPGWYQVLYNKGVAVLKVYEKKVVENTPFGLSVTEQAIKTKEKYYLLYNQQFYALNKVEDVPAVLQPQKTALQQYIKSLNKTLPLDDQLVAVAAYYNTLQ